MSVSFFGGPLLSSLEVLLFFSDLLVLPPWYIDGRNPFFFPFQYLVPGVGNNGFSFALRDDRKKLLITPLEVGSIEDLRVGEEIVFQDFDEHSQWREWVGLERALLCLEYPVPLYVVDNHNHVFYCWMEALQMGWFGPSAALLHMDAHFDDGRPEIPPHEYFGDVDIRNMDLEKVFAYTNQVLKIATYIVPAMSLSLFSSVLNFVESAHFKRFSEASGDVVMNIDLDVFCDEMNHIAYAQKLEVLRWYLSRTRLITFATSPGFMDQEKAIIMCKKLVRDLFPGTP